MPKIVSLFCGAGGLDLGFVQQGFELALAIDKSAWAIETHKRNFADVRSIAADLIELGPAGVIEELGSTLQAGTSIGVIGGPPCQGFSRANVGRVASDPRNELPLLYLKIIEALQTRYDVKFILFENVLGILDPKNRDVFNSLVRQLRLMNLSERVEEYCALDFGVPQNRRRIILSAFENPSVRESFSPVRSTRKDLDVRSAIDGLPEPAFYSPGLTRDDIQFHPNHWTMRPRSKKFSAPSTISAKSRSFRRLQWGEPSPTVAYGHREIHVHPSGARRLSIYEAMKLQGFPDNFELLGPLSAQVEQVSNAVPPPLASSLAAAIAAAHRGSHPTLDADTEAFHVA